MNYWKEGQSMIDLRSMTKEGLLELEQGVRAEIQTRCNIIDEIEVKPIDFFLTFDIGMVSRFLESKGFQFQCAINNTNDPTWLFTRDKPLSEKKLKKLMKEANRLECLEGEFA